MKTSLVTLSSGLACVLGLGLSSATAGIYYSTGTPTITDGSSVGITSMINVSGAGGIASSGDNVNVTLNLSGGNIGDLVAYLSFGGTSIQLLDRPGVTGGNPLGYTGNSSFVFNPVTLIDGTGLTSVDSYGGGSVSSAVSYNPTAGSTGFQAFNGQASANGNWTLFFADLSGGDGANVTTLNGWSLDVTAVPEPINVALAIFGVSLAGVAVVRRYRQRASSAPSAA